MRSVWAGAALLALAACGGNPLNNDKNPGDTNPPPPPTNTDTAAASISKTEAKSADGSGYATNITYNSANDTLTVQNLAFTGDKTFTKDSTLSATGPYEVFDGPNSYADDITGTSINQFAYRAIYAKSASGATQFAIVRTGAYTTYGFGGFLYQRNGGVTLPTSGQANYAGSYEGLMDFNGSGGLALTTGTAAMQIDFSGFNSTATGAAAAAINGTLSNRHVYDMNGNDLTNSLIAALNSKYSASLTALPTALFNVGPGVLNSAGVATGALTSNVVGNTGTVNIYESGTYYVLLAGPNASEAVGVVVMTSTDPSNSSITQRETSGFLLMRH